MLDLTKYPKFLRDTEGHVQTLEIMVVVGWQNTSYGYFEDTTMGSPKSDAIFISQSEQAWEKWSEEDPHWTQRILDLQANAASGSSPLSGFNDDIPIFWFDFGLKLPYFEEKVDFFTRKYSVNDLSLELENYDVKDISSGNNLWGQSMYTNDSSGLEVPYAFGRTKGNFKFSDLVKIRPILNEEVMIFLKSPSATNWNDLVPVYRGVITEYKHNAKKANISLEDISDYKFNKEMPSQLLPVNSTSPERFKDKPIPMQYGYIDRALTYFARAVDSASFQDIIYVDKEPIRNFISKDIELPTAGQVHQSPLFIYDEGYWNLSRNTADSDGNYIPPGQGGVPNFDYVNDNRNIILIGSTHNDLYVNVPGSTENTIELSKWASAGYYGQGDTATDAIYDIYFGDDNEAGLDNYEAEIAEYPGLDISNENLFNLRNDSVNNKFRIHAFSSPEDVTIKTYTKRHGGVHGRTEAKSYQNETAHQNNSPDQFLNMDRCFNRNDDGTLDTESFVEVVGVAVVRYRYKRGNRSVYYPVFELDFGSSGSLPFQDYLVLTDSAYYMKAVWQCSHSVSFGVYSGEHSVFVDQGSGWVAALNPAINYPTQNGAFELNQPGGTPYDSPMHWHRVIDTIDGNSGNLVTDLNHQLDVDNLWENTSQLAQQKGKINIGPVEGCLRRNNVNWIQDGNQLIHNTFSWGNSTHARKWQGGGATFVLRLYNVAAFSTILVERNDKYNFYVNLQGRENSSDTGTGSDDFIRKPNGIIKNIIGTELADRSIVDDDSFQEADTLHNGWYLDGSIFEKEEGKKVIQKIAKSSKCVPGFNSLGKFKFNTIKMNYEWDDATEILSGDVIKFDIDRTPIRDIYTKISLKYHLDYATSSYLKTYELDYSQLEHPLIASFENNGQVYTSTYSPDFHTLTHADDSVLNIESDMIRSDVLRFGAFGYAPSGMSATEDVTAKKLCNFLLALHANQHTILKLSLPLKYFYLEVGDVFRLDSLLGDGQAYAFGEDYTKLNVRNGQFVYPVFYITKVKRRLDKAIEIEGMQMHFLNESSSSNHGWQVPDEPDFIIYGCQDPAALNYEPNSTFPTTCIFTGDLDNNGRIDFIDVALLTIALADNDPLLQQVGTPLYRQLDIDQDGIISIRDIWQMVASVLMDENIYGCMDGGYGFWGPLWGNPNAPAAYNYDPDALVHIDSLCEYAGTACGPEVYATNWCVSYLDAYSEEFCFDDSREDLTPDHASEDFDSIMAQYYDSEYANTPWQQRDAEGYLVMHRNGLWHNEQFEMYPPTGFAWYKGDNYNPNAGIYLFNGDIHNDEVYLKNNHFVGYEPYDRPFDNHYMIHSVLFMPIEIKAGHEYLFLNVDELDTPDCEDCHSTYPYGAGYEFYIGSYLQNPATAYQNNNNYNSSSWHYNSVINPCWSVPLGQIRMGMENVFNEDTFSEDVLKLLPKSFIAPDNSNLIPARWDLAGPNIDGLRQYIYPDVVEQWMSSDWYNHVSPKYTTYELWDKQTASDVGTQMGSGQFNGSQRLWLNKSFKDYYQDSGYDGQDSWNGAILPMGYRYKTNLCICIRAGYDYNGFGAGTIGFGPEELFSRLRLIDLTENPNIKQAIDDTLDNCHDSYKGTTGDG